MDLAEAGRSKTPQWRNVPLGASGSSITRAKLLVPAGGSLQLSDGLRSPPSQVNCLGILWPLSNALLVSLSLASVASCMAASPLDSSFAPQLAIAMQTISGRIDRSIGIPQRSLRSSTGVHRPVFQWLDCANR